MVVEAIAAGADRVTFWVRGSTYRMTVSRSAFATSFTEHCCTAGLSEGLFRVSWLPSRARLKGYSSELPWNGWACPFFTRDEGIRLVGFMGGKLTFDASSDRFVETPEGFGQVASYEGRDVLLEGEAVRMYGIGVGAWCWKRVSLSTPRAVGSRRGG